MGFSRQELRIPSSWMQVRDALYQAIDRADGDLSLTQLTNGRYLIERNGGLGGAVRLKITVQSLGEDLTIVRFSDASSHWRGWVPGTARRRKDLVDFIAAWLQQCGGHADGRSSSKAATRPASQVRLDRDSEHSAAVQVGA